MNIYVIAPVDETDKKTNARVMEYVSELEFEGNKVFTMLTSYQKGDKTGWKTCRKALRELNESDEIHVFWSENSANVYFELGMAFALNRDIILVNAEDISPNEIVSFENMVCYWSYWDEK